MAAFLLRFPEDSRWESQACVSSGAFGLSLWLRFPCAFLDNAAGGRTQVEALTIMRGSVCADAGRAFAVKALLS